MKVSSRLGLIVTGAAALAGALFIWRRRHGPHGPATA
jgi:hypothetical protein